MFHNRSIENHEHDHHHKHHNHENGHTYEAHPNSAPLNQIDSLLDVDPNSNDPTHCHDAHLDQIMADQTRKAIAKLIFGLIMCFIFMIVELIGGYLSKSLAIFSDAAHLTSDLVSFGISLAAIYLGQKHPTKSKTFGYYRFEVLGVLISVFTIWSITGLLIYLAIHRMITQEFEIESRTMLIVSSIGLGMNFIMIFVLSGGLGHCWTFIGVCVPRKLWIRHVRFDESELDTPEVMNDESTMLLNNERIFGNNHGHVHSHGIAHGHSHMNMNVRAAILHIIGDIIQSIGVLIASIVIHIWPQLKLADPICTLIFGVIVFLTTYPILGDALNILMEGFPREFQYDAVRKLLLDRLPPIVVQLHSLHIWSLTHGRNALTVHITVDREKIVGDSTAFEQVRKCAEKVIRAELGISQTTIQVEYHQPIMVDSCKTCIGPKK